MIMSHLRAPSSATPPPVRRRRALLCFALVALALPAAASPSLQARLDALSREYEALNVNAVVLVGNRDGVQYEAAFGHANPDTREPLAVSTRFKTESVGKMFTATRVLQLVEQGRLGLDDSAAQYLPGWRIPDLDRITVHQLLTHTAGLASPWDHPGFDFSREYTPAEWRRIIEEVPPASVPGGRYFYSNSGYYLLGEIIAAVTGTDYESDLRRHVFDAAGMTGIDHLGATAMPAGAAQPYRYLSSQRWVPFAQGVTPKAIAAGGWVSDAHALFAYARSYLGGEFIDADAMRMQRSANGTFALDRTGSHYGYGVEVFIDTHVPGCTVFGHTGGGGGFSIDLFMEPESGLIVVTMSNMYAMNRDMSTNYLRAALDMPTRPARHGARVRTVDRLLRDGIEPLRADPAGFFAALDVPKYPRHFLADIAHTLDELGRGDLARGVEAVSLELHGTPEPGA